MITALRHAVLCDHAQYSSTGQLTFIGVAGDALVVDVVPFARKVWLGLSIDLDVAESAAIVRVEAPGYDHAMTIVIPAGPTNTGLMFPVTVPVCDGGQLVVSVSNVGGPEREFPQAWRLDGETGFETLPDAEAAQVLEEANTATASVFAQIAAQQAAARH